jgi:hypothetical protein
MSVRIRAAGWTMSRSYQGEDNKLVSSLSAFQFPLHVPKEEIQTFITVAPSLVMVCLPLLSTSRRSPP